MEDDNRWHLDRRFPLALIVALLIQSAGAVWWAASTSGRVTALEKWQDTRPMSIPEDTGERIIVLEARLSNIIYTLERIEKKLERIDRELFPPRKRTGVP